ncbi:MAG: type II toxin-antitoxin system RelE/ParE family toxin [Gemmatimonadota bacterium]
MSRRLIFRDEAEFEVDEAAGWYGEQSPGLGLEFLRSVEAAIAAIRRHPEQFPMIYRQARRAILRRFPYSVLFTSFDEQVVVLAVFHFRRDPADWVDRIDDQGG